MRVTFERIDSQDGPHLAEFLSGDEWPFHTGGRLDPAVVTERLARGYYDNQDNRTFWLLVDDERAGLIRLMDLGDDTPMFDLRIASAHRGRGHGERALRWLTDHLFGEFPQINRIEGTTRQDNRAMRRTFRKVGYVKESHYRQAWPDTSGNQYDSVGYALLRKDWETGTTTPVRWDDEPA